jgi:hypothetical protein
MGDKMATVFTTTLTSQDWDQNLGGWRCPALGIPSIVVDAMFVSGKKADTRNFEVLAENEIIRWSASDDHPSQATVSLRINKELSTQELTSRWKKLAIVLPVVASIVVAIVSPILTHRFSGGPTGATATPLDGVLKVERQETGLGNRLVYTRTLVSGGLIVGDAVDFQDQGANCIVFGIRGPGTMEFSVKTGAWDRYSGVNRDAQAIELIQNRVDALRANPSCNNVNFPVVMLPATQ